MKRVPKSIDVLKRIEELAYGKANDAVKLVLFDLPENRDLIDQLDLSLLSELKRGSNGVIEIKLINRLHALELLAKLVGANASSNNPHAESFFKAMDDAAERLN